MSDNMGAYEQEYWDRDLTSKQTLEVLNLFLGGTPGGTRPEDEIAGLNKTIDEMQGLIDFWHDSSEEYETKLRAAEVEIKRLRAILERLQICPDCGYYQDRWNRGKAHAADCPQLEKEAE